MFLICGILCLAMMLFAYLFVPETFGKTLEDMEDHYRKICYGDEEVSPNQDQSDKTSMYSVCSVKSSMSVQTHSFLPT